MDATNWLTWFRGWLTKHPLKEPPETLQHRYTEEVMRRIQLAEAPAPVYRWVPRPRVAFALATATACALTLVVWMQRPSTPGRVVQQEPAQPVEVAVQPELLSPVEEPTQVAQQIEQEWDALSELGEAADVEDLLELSDADLEEDLQRLDELSLLASAPPEEDLEQILQLLGEFDALDEPFLSGEDELSEEELLEELQELDESALLEQASS